MEKEQWQTTLPGVKARNLHAFENSKFCDIEFNVVDGNGEQGTIPAHKYILAISSPVFEAMFYGPLGETTRIINIPDCTKEGLKEILRYVYTDELTINENNVMEILNLSRKYNMPFLEKKCNDFIYNEVNSDDVFTVLPLVQRLQNQILEKRCWFIIDKYTRQAVKSEAFLDIPRDLLCQILSRDSLEIQEIELFKAVDHWVSKKIKDRSLDENGDTKREIVGDDVIRLLRFPTMAMDDFVKTVLESEILHKFELTEVFKRFKSIEPSTSIFNTTPRTGLVERGRQRRPSPPLSRSRRRSRSRSRTRTRTRTRSRSRSQSQSPRMNRRSQRLRRSSSSISSRSSTSRSRSPSPVGNMRQRFNLPNSYRRGRTMFH